MKLHFLKSRIVFCSNVLLLFLFCSCESKVEPQAQINPMFESGKTWIVIQHSSAPTYGCLSSFFNLSGDTIINNASYSILNESSACNNEAQTFAKYYVREEDKKVYALNANMTTEILWYDYNLQVLDTFRHWHLESIDVEKINGVPRNVFKFKHNCADLQMNWIEGIGCTNGLFYTENVTCSGDGLVGYSMGGASYELSCVSQDGDRIYDCGNYDDCILYIPQ